MKKELLLFAVATSTLLAACSSVPTEANSMADSLSETVEDVVDSSDAVKAAIEDQLRIEDIDWSVGMKVDDYGDRSLMCQYTNNSSLSILGVEVKYSQKDDLTDEDRQVLSDLKDTYGYTDEELKDLYMTASVEFFTYPGESSNSQYVKLDDYLARVPSSEDQFNLMEPDVATIVYVTPNNTVRLEYYDYKSGEYSLSNNYQTDVYQSPKRNVKSYFIDIDTPFLQSTTDRDERYYGTAYHISFEDYNSYKDEWINAGYTNVDYESDNSYRATNADGVEVDLEWYGQNNCVVIEIDVPQQDKTK